MQQKEDNPLGEKNFSQAERDRVLQKFEMLTNLYGQEKAQDLLSENEMSVMMNIVANEAIERYDEKLVEIAFMKIRKAMGNKPPKSEEELVRLSDKCLNTDEKAALIGYYAQKMRDPRVH